MIESTGNDRESVLISLATVPDGATITSVDVQVWHRGDSAAGGTFQTFARLNGTDTDSGTDIAAVGNSGGCAPPATQNINVADTVKAGGTALEVGVLKTAANGATVRVGAIRAVVNYSVSSEGPFTYDLSRAAFVLGTCDWDNATINNVSSSQFTPGSDMSLGVHCWRVRALDHAGLAGPWSAHRTLTIEPKDVTAEITAANKVYDGSADADYTCQVVGADIGDDVDCDGDHPGSFDTASAGPGKTVRRPGSRRAAVIPGATTSPNDSDTDLADINKADPDCTVTGYSGAYDGDPHGASGSCAGVNDEGPLAGLDLGQSFTNVPGGTANWSFTDQSGNYTNDDGSVAIDSQRPTPTARSRATRAPMTATPTARPDRARASTTRDRWPGSTWAKASPTSPAGPPTGPSPTKAATTQTTTARSRSRSQRPTPTARSRATRAPTTGDPHGASGSCAGVNDEGPLAGFDLGQSFTNVPGGTANWSFTDQSGNYTNDDGSVAIEISKADPDCTVTGYSGAYDGDPHGASDRARASTTRGRWPGSTWAKASPTSPAGPPTGPSPTKAATTPTTTARSRSRSTGRRSRSTPTTSPRPTASQIRPSPTRSAASSTARTSRAPVSRARRTAAVRPASPWPPAPTRSPARPAPWRPTTTGSKPARSASSRSRRRRSRSTPTTSPRTTTSQIRPSPTS